MEKENGSVVDDGAAGVAAVVAGAGGELGSGDGALGDGAVLRERPAALHANSSNRRPPALGGINANGVSSANAAALGSACCGGGSGSGNGADKRDMDDDPLGASLGSTLSHDSRYTHLDDTSSVATASSASASSVASTEAALVAEAPLATAATQQRHGHVHGARARVDLDAGLSRITQGFTQLRSPQGLGHDFAHTQACIASSSNGRGNNGGSGSGSGSGGSGSSSGDPKVARHSAADCSVHARPITAPGAPNLGVGFIASRPSAGGSSSSSLTSPSTSSAADRECRPSTAGRQLPRRGAHERSPLRQYPPTLAVDTAFAARHVAGLTPERVTRLAHGRPHGRAAAAVAPPAPPAPAAAQAPAPTPAPAQAPAQVPAQAKLGAFGGNPGANGLKRRRPGLKLDLQVLVGTDADADADADADGGSAGGRSGDQGFGRGALPTPAGGRHRLSLSLAAIDTGHAAPASPFVTNALATNALGANALGARTGASAGASAEAANDSGAFTRVFDFLYIGGLASMTRGAEPAAATLARHRISCAINCSARATPPDMRVPGGGPELTLYLRDRPSQDVSGTFLAAVDFIEQARATGGRALVYCMRGISRSATIVLAYIIWRRRCSYESALATLKDRRPGVCPNMGFGLQLVAWAAARPSVVRGSSGARVGEHGERGGRGEQGSCLRSLIYKVEISDDRTFLSTGAAAAGAAAGDGATTPASVPAPGAAAAAAAASAWDGDGDGDGAGNAAPIRGLRREPVVLAIGALQDLSSAMFAAADADPDADANTQTVASPLPPPAPAPAPPPSPLLASPSQASASSSSSSAASTACLRCWVVCAPSTQCQFVWHEKNAPPALLRAAQHVAGQLTRLEDAPARVVHVLRGHEGADFWAAIAKAEARDVALSPCMLERLSVSVT